MQLENTLLHEAASAGHTETVQLLIAAKIDVGALTNCGGTALYWCVVGFEVQST